MDLGMHNHNSKRLQRHSIHVRMHAVGYAVNACMDGVAESY